MNENTNPIVEETAIGTEDTTPDFRGDIDSDDDWNDLDFSDVRDDSNEEMETPEAPEPEPEADQQDGQEEDGGDQETDTEEKDQTDGQEAADQQLFDLKHLGEVKQVSRDEVIALAQKGMNYDHIRGERDTARQEVARLVELENFLKELAAPQGMSVQDLMDSTRASILAEREGLDPNVALQRVKLDRDRKAFEAQQQQRQQAQQQQTQEEARQRDSFLRFAKEYPDVDPKTIPKEVWERFGAGVDLADAYTRHENKRLREELSSVTAKLEAEKTNTKNRQRSTGSQKSAGAENQKMDPIDRDWYDGT